MTEEFTEKAREIVDQLYLGPEKGNSALWLISKALQEAYEQGKRTGRNNALMGCAKLSDEFGSEQDAMADEVDDSREVDAYLNQATAAHYLADKFRDLIDRGEK